MSELVIISLGSNVGNRIAYLTDALAALKNILTDFSQSRIYETEPWRVEDTQPAYLNMIAAGYTKLTPPELLALLVTIENEAGRTDKNSGLARTLDLDIILMGNTIYDTPELKIPHPQFRKRNFVLQPLAELFPELQDPVTGKNIKTLLEDCNDTSGITPLS